MTENLPHGKFKPPCAEDPEKWFPEGTKKKAMMAAAYPIHICRTQCPVWARKQCLRTRIPGDPGVWGGFYFMEGKRKPAPVA